MSSARVRFKGQFKTHFPPWCFSHWCFSFQGLSGAIFSCFRETGFHIMSVWYLLSILKRGLTKAKENSIRTVPAMHSITVLPFAKLKPAMLTSGEHLQADVYSREVTGQNVGVSKGLAANPHPVSQLCLLSLQSCRGDSSHREWWGTKWWSKVSAWNSSHHNMMWIHRSFMELPWQRSGSCAGIHSFP